MPPRRSAIDGDEGGKPVKYERARSVASKSAPAKTVPIASGRFACCSASAMPGRALPAAQPLEVGRRSVVHVHHLRFSAAGRAVAVEGREGVPAVGVLVARLPLLAQREVGRLRLGEPQRH